MIFVIILTFCVLGFGALYSIAEKKFKLQLVIVTFMYLFYIYLWYDRYYMITNVKAAWIGYDLFIYTILTTPLYLIFHSIALFNAKGIENRKIAYLNITGIVLCIAHVILVAANI
ncbi:hypothetical protein [Flavobacterium suzhouense]|uniref:Uncharacterized protein n=1 Tax=Flavobacterium suzhouense TaxID=1529638 RepID=A0ABW5NTW9_9FLAO